MNPAAPFFPLLKKDQSPNGDITAMQVSTKKQRGNGKSVKDVCNALKFYFLHPMKKLLILALAFILTSWSKKDEAPGTQVPQANPTNNVNPTPINANDVHNPPPQVVRT